MEFREATLADKTRLLEFEQGVLEAERPFNDDIKESGAYYYDIDELITSPSTYLLVAQEQGEIVATGYAKIQTSKASLSHEQHGYLGFMYVKPDFRGKGVNAKVMEHLVSWCKKQDVTHLYLDVYADNDSAIKAYEKVGFTPSLVEMKLKLD